MNSQKGVASGTKYFDLKDKKEVEVGQGLSLTLVPSGKKMLVRQAGRLVELTVSSKPEVIGSHNVVVKPIASESPLYYYNWVQNNIKKVSEATNGRVGYIHIPDMGVLGLNQFIEHYYPQLNKEALIIDDRGNGGGNVSPQII